MDKPTKDQHLTGSLQQGLGECLAHLACVRAWVRSDHVMYGCFFSESSASHKTLAAGVENHSSASYNSSASVGTLLMREYV